MNPIFLYEYHKIKEQLKYFSIWIGVTQCLSVLIFTIIGQIDSTEDNAIFQNFNGIIALSSTVTMSVTTLYMIAKINRELLVRYIGNYRERTYTYPIGRKELFLYKLFAIVSYYFNRFLVMNFILYCIYYIACKNLSFIKINTNNLNGIIYILLIILLSFLTSIFILLVSIWGSIKYQSTNISIVISISCITLLGNFIATTYLLHYFVIIILEISVLFISYLLMRCIGNRIQKDMIL